MYVSVSIFFLLPFRISDWDFAGGEKKCLCPLKGRNTACESCWVPRNRSPGKGAGSGDRQAEGLEIPQSTRRK